MTTELAERRRNVERALADLRCHVDREMGALLQELQAIEREEAKARKEREGRGG